MNLCFLRAKSVDDIEGQYVGLIKLTSRGTDILLSAIDWLPKTVCDRIDMTGMLARLVSVGERVVGVPLRGPWGEIDSERDLALYEQMLAADRTRRLNFLLAYACLKLQRWKEACDAAEREIGLAPGDGETVRLRDSIRALSQVREALDAVIRDGEEAFGAGDLAAAMARFQYVVERDPKRADAWNNLEPLVKSHAVRSRR